MALIRCGASGGDNLAGKNFFIGYAESNALVVFAGDDTTYQSDRKTANGTYTISAGRFAWEYTFPSNTYTYSLKLTSTVAGAVYDWDGTKIVDIPANTKTEVYSSGTSNKCVYFVAS